jgi:hypothetical protein
MVLLETIEEEPKTEQNGGKPSKKPSPTQGF